MWSTPLSNETKFNQAYQESRNVLLIFSVKVCFDLFRGGGRKGITFREILTVYKHDLALSMSWEADFLHESLKLSILHAFFGLERIRAKVLYVYTLFKFPGE